MPPKKLSLGGEETAIQGLLSLTTPPSSPSSLLRRLGSAAGKTRRKTQQSKLASFAEESREDSSSKTGDDVKEKSKKRKLQHLRVSPAAQGLDDEEVRSPLHNNKNEMLAASPAMTKAAKTFARETERIIKPDTFGTEVGHLRGLCFKSI